mmetsp:Transcript_10656/g.43089  ORF Transcript_10656/g.43089 Transcript_10656/m.43089 type:complete len:297 (-) Transcript_10656:352-1242(-)
MKREGEDTYRAPRRSPRDSCSPPWGWSCRWSQEASRRQERAESLDSTRELGDLGGEVRREEFGDGGPRLDGADGVGEEFSDGELPDFSRPFAQVGREFDRVRHDEFVDGGRFDELGGVAREERVRREGEDALRALVFEVVRGGTQRAARVDHVIHDDAVAIAHVADERQRVAGLADRDAHRERGRLVGLRQEAIGEELGARDAGGVGRDDGGAHEILGVEVRDRRGRGVQIVDGARRREEALDLRAVQVDREHAVDAHGLHHRRDVGARDGHAHAARLVRLPRVRVVREHGRHGGR